MYAALLTLHVGCAALSLLGFVARGVLHWRDSPLLQTRLLRILPHVIDTVLLGSAIGLAVLLGQYPFTTDWLTVKLLALLLYIALGVAAFRSRGHPLQPLFFAAAVLTFAYIVSVAVLHTPRGILALLTFF